MVRPFKGFNNVKEIEVFLMKKIEEILKDRDSNFNRYVMEKQALNVEKIVYQSYTPKVYSRRANGLSDTSNMIPYVDRKSGKVLLTIINETPHSESYGSSSTLSKKGDLAQLVEGGHGYNGLLYSFSHSDFEYLKPRPFQKFTMDELRKEVGYLASLIKKDLRERGIVV